MEPVRWEHWQRMPQVELWAAVALSCNLDPKPNHSISTLSDFRAAHFSTELEDFSRRMDVALAHVKSGSLRATDEPWRKPSDQLVSLPAFAEWVDTVFGKDVPEEFAAIAGLSTGYEPFAFDPGGDTYPEELDLAVTAWRAVSRKPDASRTPKVQIRDWLTKHNPKLSAEARERIAVVGNWNRRGGKPRRD